MNLPTAKNSLILGVDIGGTKIAAAIITNTGEIIHSLIEPTLQEGPQPGIQQIIRMLDTLIQQSGYSPEQFIGIGIGIPAVLEKDTDFIIWGPNLKEWKLVDLRGALYQHFHMPICIEYDGHTAVLGEWWMGAAKGYQSAVTIIIGTGVGGGMVLEGHLIRGFNRLAGAAGWFILNPESEFNPDKERSLGSWEARIAGPGIALRAQRILQKDPTIPSLLRSKGEDPTAKMVFEAAQQGDPLAQKISSEEAELLGMGIANIVSLVNPEIVILGGSVGSHAQFLLPQIKKTINRYAQPISAQSITLTTSQLGANAGLLGAAYGILLRLQHTEFDE